MQSKLVEALAVGELSWQDYASCRGADKGNAVSGCGNNRLRPHICTGRVDTRSELP